MDDDKLIEIINSTEFRPSAEIIEALWAADDTVLDALFSCAQAARKAHTGDSIFPYGFVYFSTYCRNSCNFCYFRKENKIERYRKSEDETVAISDALVASGVDLIDLTMGEDPVYHNEDFDTLYKIIRRIKSESNIPVMVSPGVVSDDIIRKLASLGTDFYALYQETHNRDLFAKLRVGQDYDARMHAKEFAGNIGMHIEEGLLSGIGESSEDVVHSLNEMGRIRASQIRVMSFVPQEGSPMEGSVPGERKRELILIALMRIMYPHVLIPASLDVDGLAGLIPRINAGANVVASIIQPGEGLQGVASSDLQETGAGRTVDEVKPLLAELGLSIAGVDEYRAYLNELK
jgi:methylornithine synthase